MNETSCFGGLRTCFLVAATLAFEFLKGAQVLLNFGEQGGPAKPSMGKGGDSVKAAEVPLKMGGEPSKGGMQTDFLWVETDEPHASRRKQILAAHPEVRELFGPDENAVYKVRLNLVFLCIGRFRGTRKLEL